MVPICLYCLNCTEFGQLIRRKIIEIVGTRCQMLRLDLLAGFKGPTSKGREGREGKGGEGMGNGRE